MPLLGPDDPAPTVTIRTLSNAAWTLLQTLAPTIPIFDTFRYDTPTVGTWGIYHPEGGDRTNRRHGGIATDLRWGFDLMCVGRTREQCEWVVDTADALLIGVQLAGNDYTSCLYPTANGARMQPEPGDPIGARFSLNRHYQLRS